MQDTFACTEQISRSRALKRVGATVDVRGVCDELARLCTHDDIEAPLTSFFTRLRASDPALGELLGDPAPDILATRDGRWGGAGAIGVGALLGAAAGEWALHHNVNIADPLHLTTSAAGQVQQLRDGTEVVDPHWQEIIDVDGADMMAPALTGAVLGGLVGAGVYEYQVRFSDAHQLFAATALLTFHALCAVRDWTSMMSSNAKNVRILIEYLRCDGPTREYAASFQQLFGAIDRRGSVRVPVRLPHAAQRLLAHEAPCLWYVLAAPFPVRYDKGEGVLEVAWDAETESR